MNYKNLRNKLKERMSKNWENVKTREKGLLEEKYCEKRLKVRICMYYICHIYI